jgi:hypothetical protein
MMMETLQCKSNLLQYINISDEFVKAYILLEEKLKMQRIKYKKIEDDLIVMRDKQNRNMIMNKNEKLNENGISDDSVLNITLFEGRDLKAEDFLGSFNPVIVLKIGTQKDISNVKPNTIDPVWNENFSL